MSTELPDSKADGHVAPSAAVRFRLEFTKYCNELGREPRVAFISKDLVNELWSTCTIPFNPLPGGSLDEQVAEKGAPGAQLMLLGIPTYLVADVGGVLRFGN